MAEGDATVFNDIKEQLLRGTHSLQSGADVIKVALLDGYSPNVDTHQTYGDVSANETGVAGHTAGGETLGSQTVAQNSTTNAGVFDGADVTYSSLGAGNPSHAVMYNDTPTAPANPIMFAWELVTNSNGGDYTLQWAGTGIATVS